MKKEQSMKTINDALTELKKIDDQEVKIFEFVKNEMLNQITKDNSNAHEELKYFFDYIKKRNLKEFILPKFIK